MISPGYFCLLSLKKPEESLKMKKLLSFAAALFVLLSCFAPATAEAGKISVVTTIFPIYDWVREIVGAR